MIRPSRIEIVLGSLIAGSFLLFISACSKSNNVFLGRVEAKVGSNLVVVTDCYKTSVRPPQLLKDANDGRPFYRFLPCLDADVVINGDQLIVNGQSYGLIGPQDTVIVDHGTVLVNGHKTSPSKGNS